MSPPLTVNRPGSLTWCAGGAAAPKLPPALSQGSIADWQCAFRWSTPRR